jgi:glycosyltransferase involved in cell wall biosynthesis
LLGEGRLIIAGTGPELGKWQRWVSEAGIAAHVIFAGLVPDITHVYRRLDVLMLASETEGTSRVVLEAMTEGVPVIASNVGGLPDLIDDGRTGFLCAVGDVEAFARAAERLLRNPVLRERFRDKARARSYIFSVQPMERRVREVYAEVLESVRRQAIHANRAVTSQA